MIIIVINGSAKSGKDKFVSFFKEISNLRVKNFSSIDKVKQVAEMCFNWNGKKDDKSRRLLSEMKKIWIDFNNGPFYNIIEKIDVDMIYSINNGKDINKNVYFLHIREPKEIFKIKEKYKNCITLIIDKEVDFIPNNNSDENINNFEYDYVVNNNGTISDLKIRAKEFLNFIIDQCQ